jgi:hypothetical protein
MDRKHFHKRLKEILAANRGPHNSPDEQFHDVMDKEVQGRSKKDWDNEVAAHLNGLLALCQKVRNFQKMTLKRYLKIF